MCRQAGFLNGGETALRSFFWEARPCAHISVIAYYMLFLSNEGFTFTETRLCVQLHAGTLLRQGVVLETDAVAVGKCDPDQRLSECPTEDGSRCSTTTSSSSLHNFALVRFSRLLLAQLLTFTACFPTTNKTQLWRSYGKVCRGKPHWHRDCLPHS
jgi:hypothetical protein